MTLKIEIKMDNAAFEDGELIEAARILQAQADSFCMENARVGKTWPLLDLNGNKVGTAIITR